MNNVVFVAFQEYDNLGIGYLSSFLEKDGIKTFSVDIRKSKKFILETIKKRDPIVVGFSIIFHYNFILFTEVLKYLRDNSVTCHFTAGGHYASLRHKELLENVIWLDSVIRFEGEYTMLDLVRCLRDDSDWTGIDGIAYRKKDMILTNRIRIPETELDKFPYPKRLHLRKFAFNINFATILASRGCLNDCSFCNARQFYKMAGGPLRRVREPGKVVGEMKLLYREEKCRVFLFFDDDFPVNQPVNRNWAYDFCDEIRKSGLKGKILFKIFCRPDGIEFDTFRTLKEHGLFQVFIGLEDGTDQGLKILRKKQSLSANLEAIRILKSLKLGFEFGFMLFQPSTTFRSLNENIMFLNEICGDGYTPLSFAKLEPFYETRVAKELQEEGRLMVRNGEYDYNFIENSMNDYYVFVETCLHSWMRRPGGILNLSRWIINYYSVYSRLINKNSKASYAFIKLRKELAENNLYLLKTLRELSTLFQAGHPTPMEMSRYRREINYRNSSFRYKIDNFVNYLYKIEL